ncbi:RNA polymerase sigma-70 factor, ECF subfamily [Hathewaya proteolytica DSM 3090]|uniref:RNA polymerase sigma-70 factor, ECF subfamily n=1 Tax=Hathewaya proteolytica DSM 3090 TaxID=1121331 RepID=A0A1M6T914_9CLOT|nr:RNA polymerase sigma factor [Hathewaya proteolytica]SHK53450.1 RNA polymerase sigma-70 factor, ECF subfamily [Hathewaya proteolytica DSM 3090]
MDNGTSSYYRFIQGDESGFDEIIDMYRSNLIFFINRYVNNIYIAEELAADAFVELIVHKYRFKFSRCTLKTYLFTIGKNKAVDYIRHNSKFAICNMDEISEQLKSEEKMLEEEVVSKEDKRQLFYSIKKLSEDYRIAVHLIYFEELSYKETAKIMGKSVKQVENLIYRAKASLKKIMEKEAVEYEEFR